MRHYSVPLFLLCIASTLAAESLSIRVVDGELDLPLEGVQIVADCNGVLIKGETDELGLLTLELGNQTGKTDIVLTAQYPGYADSVTTITGNETSIDIKMAIGDVIEGDEIVVQRSAGGKAEAEVGISKVIQKEEINITAQMGIVEDVMSSVKTLPGVGYTSTSSGEHPSIRGGNPDEMGVVMDGVYLIHPWHWGGSYSVFNPIMIDSAKMSHGIYSARYGKALSGLLEISTLDPNPDKLSIDFGLSTTSAELFAQIPLGKHNSIFLGGKLTFYKLLMALQDQEDDYTTILTPPYIRDFYAKWKCMPSDKFNISLNLFCGNDCMKASLSDLSKEFEKYLGESAKNNEKIAQVDYSNSLGYAALTMNIMPTEKNTIKLLGAYNFQTDDTCTDFISQEMHSYSDEFCESHSISNGTEYKVPPMISDTKKKITVHEFQGKIETDR